MACSAFKTPPLLSNNVFNVSASRIYRNIEAFIHTTNEKHNRSVIVYKEKERKSRPLIPFLRVRYVNGSHKEVPGLEPKILA